LEPIVLTPLQLQTLEIEVAETFLRLLVLFTLISVVAFFVAAEIAIVSASKRAINRLTTSSEHQTAAKLVQQAQNNLEQYLSVTQTGTTAGSLLLGWLGEGATVHWIEPWIAKLPIAHLPAMITTHSVATAIAFLFVTYVEIALGELVPKVLASQAPERTALLLIGPLQVCSYLFYPALVVLNGTVRLLTGWVKPPEAVASTSPLTQIDAYSVLIEGAIDLKTLNQQLGLNLPEDEEYRTLAGFVIHQFGHLPDQDDRVQWNELELEAVQVNEQRLQTILLRQVTRPLKFMVSEERSPQALPSEQDLIRPSIAN
jgi:CBS domain containing-hemolysin-like protein